MKKLGCVLLVLVLGLSVNGQGMAFGIKGGPSIGFQKWNTGSQRDALFAYHVAGFIESLAEEDAFAIYAQAGYHVKGGAVRSNRISYIDPITSTVRDLAARTDRYEFNNAVLSLGGKQKFSKNRISYYYMFGVRGEFTISTNLDEYSQRNSIYNTLYYPDDFFVRKFNGGVTVGGGFEFPFSELIAGLLEITVNPDFTKQYRQDPIENVYNPYTMQSSTIGSRELSNTTLEISLGIRFIRKVEYID